MQNFQSGQGPSFNAMSPLEPHHDSPLRHVLAGGLLVTMLFLGMGYWQLSKKSDDAILHSADPEVTTTTKNTPQEKIVDNSVDNNTVVVPPETDSPAGDSTEYDYQWGVSTVPGYNTFTDSEFGFSVDYPDAWEFDPTVSENGTVVSFNGNEVIDTVSRYGSASVGLMVVSPDITVDEYDQATDDSLLADPAFTYIDRGDQALGTYDGRYIVGTYDFGDGIGTVFLSVVVVNKGTAYTFNALFDYGDDTTFDAVLAHMSRIFDDMMASFVVNHAPDFSAYTGASVSDPSSIGDVMTNDLFNLYSKFEEARHVRRR